MKLVLRTGSSEYQLRTGSSEYQLHLMKVSDRDRNVNKKLVSVVFLVKFIIKSSISQHSTGVDFQ